MSNEAPQCEDHDEKHGLTVVVNGQQKVVRERELTFREVVALAYDGSPPAGENWSFTVTYRRGESEKPHGSLVAGDEVKVKEGMIFNVTATDKS